MLARKQLQQTVGHGPSELLAGDSSALQRGHLTRMSLGGSLWSVHSARLQRPSMLWDCDCSAIRKRGQCAVAADLTALARWGISGKKVFPPNSENQERASHITMIHYNLTKDVI
jgi:hypothetical protein